MVNLYHLLGIETNASIQDIQRAIARRELYKTLSPEAISKCKTYLLHSENRQRYDAKLFLEHPELFSQPEKETTDNKSQKPNKPNKPNNSMFIKGFLTGFSVAALTGVVIWGGLYVYEQNRIDTILKSIEQEQQIFAKAIEQNYWSSPPANNNLFPIRWKINRLQREEARIQKEVVLNLSTEEGLRYDFSSLVFKVNLNGKNLPDALKGQRIEYFPAYENQTLIWKCVSTLNEELRPKNCTYRITDVTFQDIMKGISEAESEQKLKEIEKQLEKPSESAVVKPSDVNQNIGFKPPIENACTKFQEKLKQQQFEVFAAGAYSGKASEYQIDDSGHEAHWMDVAVSHDKPVVLILGAYEPSIWRIKWAPNTVIAGVVLTGHHHQKIMGLPKSVPVLTTTSHQNECGTRTSYVSSENAAAINNLSQHILKQNVKAVVLATNGQAMIGNITNQTQLTHSSDTTLDQIIDKKAPLAGKKGLEQAVEQGLLRVALPADLKQWQQAYNRARKIHTPPVIGEEKSPTSSTGLFMGDHNAYVVLKPMKIPTGLYGAHSAQFILPKGVPKPSGNLGHSTIYDLSNGLCYGPHPECRR